MGDFTQIKQKSPTSYKKRQHTKHTNHKHFCFVPIRDVRVPIFFVLASFWFLIFGFWFTTARAFWRLEQKTQILTIFGFCTVGGIYKLQSPIDGFYFKPLSEPYNKPPYHYGKLKRTPKEPLTLGVYLGVRNFEPHHINLNSHLTSPIGKHSPLNFKSIELFDPVDLKNSRF